MSHRTLSITSQAYHYGISDRSNKGITEEKTDGTWMEWRVRRVGASQRTENGERKVGKASRTSIPQGRGGTKEQTL